MLNGRRENMENLLLCESEGWSTSDDTIILLTPALDLTHTLSSTIRASLVVGIDLGVAIQSIESPGKRFSENGHLTQCLISKHVRSIPVDGAIAIEDFFIITVVEGVVASGCSTAGSAI
jgi:hypothetical protein